MMHRQAARTTRAHAPNRRPAIQRRLSHKLHLLINRLTAAAALTTVAATGASPLSGAVRLGDSEIPALRVQEALRDCAHHASHLPESECLDSYFVPRWLLDLEARRRGLADSPAIGSQSADLLHVHLVSQVSSSIPQASEQEVRAYLQEHKRDFSQPLRIRLFRILVATEEQAQELIDRMGPATTLADFRAWAREHSIDKATNQRSGDLGFVWPDGSTDVPQVSADARLYEAALPLTDGQYAPQPIAEGKHYAVLWRRGSLPKVSADEDTAERIRQLLLERKTEQKIQDMLKELRRRFVRDFNPAPLGHLGKDHGALFSESSQQQP